MGKRKNQNAGIHDAKCVCVYLRPTFIINPNRDLLFGRQAT